MNIEVIKVDNWLDAFSRIIDDYDSPILDFGCGSGNNSLYLINMGKKVYVADQSENTILNIVNRRNVRRMWSYITHSPDTIYATIICKILFTLYSTYSESILPIAPISTLPLNSNFAVKPLLNMINNSESGNISMKPAV